MFTSCLEDSYVDYADVEKSMNVANETEIVTKNPSPWIQKIPTVSEQLHYTRRAGHNTINVSTTMCKPPRRPVLYPVKKMLIQHGHKNMTIMLHNESTTMAENTNRLKSCQAAMNVLGKLRPVYVNEPLALSRPNGTAFNLQCPDGKKSRTPLLCFPNGDPLPTAVFSTVSTSVPSTNLNIETAATSTKDNLHVTNVPLMKTIYQSMPTYKALSNPKLPLRGFRHSRPVLIQNQNDGTSRVCHDLQSAPKVEQTFTDCQPNYVQMYGDLDTPLCGEKVYHGIPPTPPLSMSGQLSPPDQCCDINKVIVKQNTSSWETTQSPYPASITPPAEIHIKQEVDIDYSILDEFLVRT